MKVKVSETSTRALDWLVAKVEGVSVVMNHPGWAYIPKGKRSYYKWSPTSNWKQSGPIIERELNNLFRHNQLDLGDPEVWCGCIHVRGEHGTKLLNYDGPTPLIAAMRCYVASKLGDEVEVPDKLMEVTK